MSYLKSQAINATWHRVPTKIEKMFVPFGVRIYKKCGCIWYYGMNFLKRQFLSRSLVWDSNSHASTIFLLFSLYLIGLDEVPEQVFLLKDLVDLSLAGNNITYIQDDIQNLTSVSSFYMVNMPRWCSLSCTYLLH